MTSSPALVPKDPWPPAATTTYCLLSAFASANENTLERWQVAAQLSPGNEGLSQESMQARLSQLRKKVQACGCDGEIIKAIRNSGYKLCLAIQTV